MRMIALQALLLLSLSSGCSGVTATTASSDKAFWEKAPKELTNTIGMKLVLIPAGEFMMGSPETEKVWDFAKQKNVRPDGETQHKVRLTKPFYMGATEVTQAQWKAVMGNNPSQFKNDDLPVERVTWNDCQEFLKKLSAKEGKAYRLPTEAEWEYACRAGSAARFNSGDDEKSLDAAGWYNGNSGTKTHPVGQKMANAWGLYDMHGNVWEWCHDWYGEYPDGDQIDPAGPAQGARRMLRGGSWDLNPKFCRSAFRFKRSSVIRLYTIGFRVVESGSMTPP
jgi:formylglycine-generating enzyme required for sulfatase activity